MKTAALILLSGAALFLSGCGSKSEKIPRAHLENAFPEVATFINQKADNVSQNPRSAAAWGEYAMSLDAHEFTATAILAYQTAHRLDPKETTWSYLLSQRLRPLDAPAALSLLQNALMKAPDSDLILYRIGELAEETNDLQLARDSYEAVLDLSPNHPQATFRLASILYLQQKYEAARQLLNTVKSEYREVAELKSQIFLSENQAEAAQRLLAKSSGYPGLLASFNDPYKRKLLQYRRDPLYMAMLAVEKLKLGQNWAISQLKSLLEQHPKLVQVRLLYAQALLDQTSYDLADKVLAEGVQLSPHNALLFALWASSDIAQQHWSAAEEHLRTAIEFKADYVSAHADLGYVLEQLQRDNEAIAEYEWVLKMNPADEQVVHRLKTLTSRDQ